MAKAMGSKIEISDLHDNLNFHWSGYRGTIADLIKRTMDKMLEMHKYDLSR